LCPGCTSAVGLLCRISWLENRKRIFDIRRFVTHLQ
jgi:hypothetical protein